MPTQTGSLRLLAIGERYLVFQTIYGIPHYIVLGGVLIAVGFVSIWFLRLSTYQIATAGGAIELLLSVVNLRQQECGT